MSAKHCSYCGKQLGPNRRVNDGQYFCEECWPRRGDIKTVIGRKIGPRENPRHREALLEDMSAVFSRYRFVNDIHLPMGRDEFLSMIALSAIESFLKNIKSISPIKPLQNKNGLWNDRPQDDDDVDNL